ncbi:ABC transporter substrate-binding protein [Microbacterium sp.]|uniref:ABC transporter substrate-binding protein n=1 Tax=Microbacterium sp. TaxID=51671 RepID=UPI003C727814
MSLLRPIAALSLVAASALVLTACAGDAAPAATESTPVAAEDYYPVTVTDMAGNEVTIESADSVAITDNRFFQLAADWDLPVTVAPRDLMSPNNPLKDDEAILNTGTHREPDFEQIVAADPDLVINGYRYGGDTAQGVKDAAPDAAFVDTTGPEDQSADDYVVESLTLMGEIFNKKAEAEELIDQFHAAVADAKDAYDPATTVLGLVTSGGEINYSNPADGRGASIFFSLLDLTPALESEGTSDHTGDSVSLEALAQSNADVLLVLDRDAAFEDDQNPPALELINGSTALASLPAVENEAIYVMPGDYYLTEDVFAYITVLDGLAEVFSGVEQ